MSDLPPETDTFIAEFDAAIEAHMEWTHRVLRCAVLHTPPGEDVLQPMAHTLCRFGHWFTLNIAHFEAIDLASVRRIEAVHQSMHDAIRSLCTSVMNGKPGNVADLESFEKSQSELLTLLANFKTHLLSSALQNDPLTGLPLRHSIENDFTLCQQDTKRNHTLLYVALIDVDHFKRINDSYGHPVGDMVLRHLADTLKRTLRGNDPLYRFGGEEFLWLMRCESPHQAEQSARRAVMTIRTTPVPINGGTPLALSITLGMVQAGEQESMASAIKRADAALYEGKNAGRDRYVIG